MLAEVEPGVLVLFRYPDAAGEDLAEHEHDAEGHGERPHHRGGDREHLLADKPDPPPKNTPTAPAGVDPPAGEEPPRHGPPKAAPEGQPADTEGAGVAAPEPQA